MNYLNQTTFIIIASFALAMLSAPLVIAFAKRLKLNQTILGYVEKHKTKEGTPTFGGFIFLLPIIALGLIFTIGKSPLGVIAIVGTFAYGLLGFLDDFIKVKHKKNEGLKPYQKIIGQVGIATIIAIFAYNNINVGSSIIIPFTDIELEMSYFYIPFAVLVLIAVSNAVNLTDGLDGLAGSVSMTNSVFILVYIFLLLLGFSYSGNLTLLREYGGLLAVVSAMTGGLLGFLWHNTNKAGIFMGDTGSLALGGMLGIVCLLLRNPFMLIFIGLPYIISAISVIIQVVYFKVTGGKRVFTMAPYHHHLQDKGLSEAKITFYYVTIAIIGGLVFILSI